MEGNHSYDELQTSEGGDAQAIWAGIEAARAEDREVDDAVARAIAAQLHGGQNTALYSLASTGNLADERLRGELHALYQDPDEEIQDWAGVLATYALHREDQGPVTGWSELWPSQHADLIDHPSSPDDEADARDELMRRITSAAVTTLGAVATIHTDEGTYSRDVGDEPDSEPDAYPWSSAARWHANGLGPDELGPLPGEQGIETLPIGQLEVEVGSVHEMGWCGLQRNAAGSGGSILRETPYGRRETWSTTSDDELAAVWQSVEREYQAFADASAEHSDQDSDRPRVWVGSLADYVAGHLHGAWLHADIEGDQLSDAIQFMLKNSHEPDAEEYAVMDYDGFEGDLIRELGEYPSVQTVTRVARGIAEHGQAFGAWAAYAGVESEEQLDRFEDHYLGEWDSLTAYAEHLLEELEAYRYVEEAPEWLQPYLEIDVEMYAQDLQVELYVADAPTGSVWLFDARA